MIEIRLTVLIIITLKFFYFNYSLTMIQSNLDTIAAIATPIGIGAIAVIRVSGAESVLAVDKIFVSSKSLKKVSTHTIHYGKIVGDNKETIDDVLVSVFKSPHSYTGERVCRN